MNELKKYHEKYLLLKPDIENWSALDYSIDKDSDHYKSDDLKIMIQETHHANHKTVIKELMKLIEGLDNKVPYHLFFPNGSSPMFKVRSENFLVLECFMSLCKINIIGLVSDEDDLCSLEDGSNLLFIDDCIYTGIHITAQIKYFDVIRGASNFSYTFLTYTRSEEIICYKISPINVMHIKSHILLEPIIDNIMRYIIRCDVNKWKKAELLKSGNTLIDLFVRQMGGIGKGDLMPAIYFDHKIHPTIKPLYNDIFMKTVPSRYPVLLLSSII